MKRLTVLAVLLLVVTACDATGESAPTETAPSPLAVPNGWSGPLRVEPGGRGATFSMDDMPAGVDHITDGIDEKLPGWLDITTFQPSADDPCCVRVLFDLAVDLPVPIPGTVAYGMVADVDGDGVADVRFGMVNTSDTENRDWRTDLATGVTDPDQLVVDSFYPSDPDLLRQGLAVDRLPGEPEFRFYLWASLILGGQVVATEYSPNEGWIDPLPEG